MKSTRLKTAIVLLVFFGFSILAGCILNPEEKDDPPITNNPWPSLKTAEGVVLTLVRCYTDLNAERYLEILIDPDYLFYLQPRDVGQGEEPFWNLQQDYDATRRMFLAAIGAPENQDPLIDRLELTIGGGTWTDVDSIGDEPCLDCQYTERIYTITAVIGETTYLGEDQIIALYVEPVEDKGITVFKIRRWYDLPK